MLNIPRLFVVEDSDEEFEILSSMIHYLALDVELERARNEAEVVLALNQHLEQKTLPSLVFMDLNLIGKSGIQIIIDLRKQIEFSQLPIIVLTNSSRPKDVDAAYRAGANAYFCKPLIYGEFETLIRQILNHSSEAKGWAAGIESRHLKLPGSVSFSN